MLVGGGVLLTPLTVLAYYAWQMPMLSVVFGGRSLALLGVGFAGWAREFSSMEPKMGSVLLL